MGRVRLEGMWANDPSCHFCGVATVLPDRYRDTPKGGIPNMATEEHIVPRCLGGSLLGASNVVLACARCNNEYLSLVDKWAVGLAGVTA